MVCVKCKRHGDEVWMIKDKCKYHTFKLEHKDKVDCHIGNKVPAHKGEIRNSIFGNLGSVSDLANHALHIHKIIQ